MDAFAHIRDLIENSKYQDALDQLRSLANNQEQQNAISVLQRECKEIATREIANVTSYENLNREYNALSLRMLNFLSQLEQERQVGVMEVPSPVISEKSSPTPTPNSPDTRSSGEPKGKTLIYLAGMLLLIIAVWGVSKSIAGGDSPIDNTTEVTKENKLPEQDTPEPTPVKAKRTDIYDQLKIGTKLAPATKYTTAGAPVDLLVAVYLGLPDGFGGTDFNEGPTESVAAAIRKKTSLSVATNALTETFHASRDRQSWTNSKLSILTMNTRRANYLLLADWRADQTNARQLAYSIFDLRNKKRIGFGKVENRPGNPFRVNLEDTLVNALVTALASGKR